MIFIPYFLISLCFLFSVKNTSDSNIFEDSKSELSTPSNPIEILSEKQSSIIATNIKNDSFLTDIELHEYKLFCSPHHKLITQNRTKKQVQQQFSKILSQGMISPSPEIQHVLIQATQEIRNEMKSFFPELVNLPWTYAIFDDKLFGGMPHTRSNVIFLPQEMASILKKSQTANTPYDRYVYQNIKFVLLHEQVHVWQRNFLKKDKMIDLYKKWGFINVTIPEFTESLKKIKLSNPDTPDLGWIWEEKHPTEQSLYWLPLLAIEHEDLNYLLIPVNYHFNQQKVTWKNAPPKKMNDSSNYLNAFPFYQKISKSPYHPHEAVAYYVQYFYKIKFNQKKLSDEESKLLIELQNYFK